MAGGDIDAGDAAVFPDGEGELRGGAQGFEDANGDAVARHDAGGLPGKLVGVVAAVEADGHALPGALRSLGQDDLGKGLGGVADDVDVHLVQAHAHGAPQPGGAELQRGKKAAFDLLFISGDGLELGLLGLAEGGAVQPIQVSLLVGHDISSLYE